MNNLVYKKIHFDDGAQYFLIVLLLAQLFLNNGAYLCFGAVCFWLIFSNIQQPLKPSVFTIIFIYHFIQISAGIWLSNYLGKDINFRSDHTGTATIAGFVGLVIMFSPILYYQNKIPSISLQSLRAHADQLSLKKTLNTYIAAFFVTNALGGITFLFGGLSQVIVSLVNVKWFFFLLFGLQVFLKKRMRREFLICAAAEFILGFFSFFSEFKTVFFFIGFLAITFLTRVNFRQLVSTLVALLLLFFLAVKWTSIKGEYRSFLNKGSKSQTVGVGREDAFNKLLELSGGTSNFDKGAAEFFDRIQYTFHLAKTMDRLPVVLPFEYGGNIRQIIEYVLTPRILNANKARLEPSIKATKYTGVAYLGAKSGTSFSLGYFADCYIDFGLYGMFLPLLVLGFIFGSSYFYFIKNSSANFIFNYSVVGAIFIEFHAFEMDGTYLLGRLYATLVTFFLLKIFFFPWLYNYLRVQTETKEVEAVENKVFNASKTS